MKKTAKTPLQASSENRLKAGGCIGRSLFFFEADTRAGRIFDICLIALNLISVGGGYGGQRASPAAVVWALLHRLLRVFRFFKLAVYVVGYQSLGRALAASARKILVFLSAVLMVLLVMGTVMYGVEGQANGFTSIPTSIDWAISTCTTVGYGDITPKTDFGRLIASCMMLLDWGILAVPTGIVTGEMAMQRGPAQ